MIRSSLILTCLAVSLMSVGCCGPLGCGVGGRLPVGCNDCDGLGPQGVPYGPLDAARRFRKSLVCGSGCGEVYVGDWISNPPDCEDPCCGDQWVGGAQPCRPFAWRPGLLLPFLYGGRYCSGAESSADCGCTGGCDGGCGGEIIHDDGVVSGGTGCNCGASHSSVLSAPTPAGQPIAPTAAPQGSGSRAVPAPQGSGARATPHRPSSRLASKRSVHTARPQNRAHR